VTTTQTSAKIDGEAFRQAAKASGAAGHQRNNRWDPETKAAALALLRANSGNVKRTARIIAQNMGININPSTLRYWAENEEGAAPEEMREAANEALASVFEQATIKFAVLLASDEVIAAMAASSPRDLATSAKVTIEAMQLLRGKPTAIQSGDPFVALVRKVSDAIKEQAASAAPAP
jgi:transposase-like protein